MRTIPIDSDRVSFIGTGKAAARAEYAPDSAGNSRRTGNQDTDDNGVPLWVVDVLVDDDDADRAELVGVKVASRDEPRTVKWQPISFVGLVAVPYVDRDSGRVALSFRASGIATNGKAARPTPDAAAVS